MRGGILFVALAALLLFAPGEADARQLDRRGLQLTFSDEFDTLNLANPRDESTWTNRNWKTWGRERDPFSLHNRTLPNNGEQQAYTDGAWPERVDGLPPQSHTVENGILRIRADRAPQDLRPRIHNLRYTSGQLISWGMFSQRYGVFEARMKLPKGRGLWPAFWMVNDEGPVPPEIDIMEFLGHDTSSWWTVLHTRRRGKHVTYGQQIRFNGDITRDFHVFAVDWRHDVVNYFIDDVQVMSVPTPPDMHRRMHMVLNLAVGGRWGGPTDATTVFPAYLEVDYVRVWRKPGVHDRPAPRKSKKKKKS